MKTILVLFLVFVGAALAAPLPENVTLSNGVTLRQISIVRWVGDAVVIKHRGGYDQIALINLSAESRAALLAYRATPAAPTTKETGKVTILTGEVFVTTQGGETLPVGSAHVFAYRSFDVEKFSATIATMQALTVSDSRYGEMMPGEYWQRQEKARKAWEGIKADMPAPDFSAFSGADGKFSVDLKDARGLVFVVMADRMFARRGANYQERLLWIAKQDDLGDGDRLVCGTHNQPISP